MFDPIHFFSLARKLATGDEASVRTSVSRAYYSSFLVAREKLGLSRERVPDVHQRVVEELHARDHSTANRLHQLRRMRNRADYDLGIPVKPEDAQEALRLATRVLRWLKTRKC